MCSPSVGAPEASSSETCDRSSHVPGSTIWNSSSTPTVNRWDIEADHYTVTYMGSGFGDSGNPTLCDNSSHGTSVVPPIARQRGQAGTGSGVDAAGGANAR